MKSWISYDRCTGCSACMNACKKNAITMIRDSMRGFSYPHINEDECNNCYECKKSCPVNYERDISHTNLFIRENRKIEEVYAARAKDDTLREISTSGGLFSIFAKYILDENGVVYGASYNENMIVCHERIDTKEGIEHLRRSKYVQSEIGYIYRNVQTDLENKKVVLFVGTPCQIAGLYMYLGRDYLSLYTIEFVCLGVNSPMVFKKWIDELQCSYKKSVKEVWFKYKCSGWRESPLCSRVNFMDGTYIVLNKENNYFMKGYLNGGYFVRKSCSMCSFVGTNRYSDLIFGDYWNVQGVQDDGKGTSFVINNSKRGRELFEGIKDDIFYDSIEIEDVIECNPRFLTPASYNDKSENFLRDINYYTFSETIRKFIDEEKMPEILSKIMDKKSGGATSE